jgi:hypothetical protein
LEGDSNGHPGKSVRSSRKGICFPAKFFFQIHEEGRIDSLPSVTEPENQAEVRIKVIFQKRKPAPNTGILN